MNIIVIASFRPLQSKREFVLFMLFRLFGQHFSTLLLPFSLTLSPFLVLFCFNTCEPQQFNNGLGLGQRPLKSFPSFLIFLGGNIVCLSLSLAADSLGQQVAGDSCFHNLSNLIALGPHQNRRSIKEGPFSPSLSLLYLNVLFFLRPFVTFVFDPLS